MSTLRQKKLANYLIANSLADQPLNKQELVVSSGYSPKTADGHASEILSAKGVQKELRLQGFTVENAKRVTGEILDSDAWPRDRLTAARLIFDVEGALAPTKHINLNVNVNELQDQIAKQLALFRGDSI